MRKSLIFIFVVVCLLAGSGCAKWTYKISGFGAVHFFPNTKFFREYEVEKPGGRVKFGGGFGFEVERFKNWAFSVSGVFLEELNKKILYCKVGSEGFCINGEYDTEYTEYVALSYFDLDLKYYFISKNDFRFFIGAGFGTQRLESNIFNHYLDLSYPIGDWAHSYIAGAEYKFKYGLGIITAYRFRVYDGYKFLGLFGYKGHDSDGEVYGLNWYGNEITLGISYNFDGAMFPY